ncbi:MAG: 50S ribosomal protein L11 methyltransferase, partial [Firmicutes bacterium]|nr:50S ribosomal protein L11 methyltransferase [Bacillota bacterium]
MKYTRLSITTTTEFSDIVADTLWDCSSMGVAIYDKNDILSLAKQKRYFDYIDESLLKADPRVVVSGFFSCDFDYAAIKQKIESLKNYAYFDTGSLEIIIKDEDSEDWQNAWKAFYKPLEIGKITVVPQWLKP